MRRQCCSVIPTFSAGSPAQVDTPTAQRVADQERRAYERTLLGIYGDATTKAARARGLEGIAYSWQETGNGATVIDLITGDRKVFARFSEFTAWGKKMREKTRAYTDVLFYSATTKRRRLMMMPKHSRLCDNVPRTEAICTTLRCLCTAASSLQPNPEFANLDRESATMRYTVTKQIVQVLGVIWMPAVTCAQTKELSAYDLANIGNVRDRDAVEHWLMLHSGDFQSVTDFRADFTVDGESVVHEWQRGDESEMAFNDCMYPNDDDN